MRPKNKRSNKVCSILTLTPTNMYVNLNSALNYTRMKRLGIVAQQARRRAQSRLRPQFYCL